MWLCINSSSCSFLAVSSFDILLLNNFVFWAFYAFLRSFAASSSSVILSFRPSIVFWSFTILFSPFLISKLCSAIFLYKSKIYWFNFYIDFSSWLWFLLIFSNCLFKALFSFSYSLSYFLSPSSSNLCSLFISLLSFIWFPRFLEFSVKKFLSFSNCSIFFAFLSFVYSRVKTLLYKS